MIDETLMNLLAIKTKYEIVCAAIMNSAKLNYDGSGLTFNDSILDAVLSACEPEEREEMFLALKKKAADAEMEGKK